MVSYDKIELADIIKNTTKCYKYNHYKKQTEYFYNIPIAFDIETTSTYSGDNKFAFMYLWSMAIGQTAFYGRDMDSFREFLKQLTMFLELSNNNRILIYVHNLPFEYQFIRKYFNWDSVFAVDERRAIKAVSNGIEFRDSYILSGHSLETLAKNLKSGLKKLNGDLKYDLIRHSKTPLIDKELSYCENDVLIVTDYIREQINEYGDIISIPLTNTGRVRKYMSELCLPRKKSSGQRYRKMMSELTLSPKQYAMCKKAFMGGFVHASLQHVNRTLHDVASIDFNSSYPYSMLSELYPMSSPTETLNEKELFDTNRLSIIRIRFYNLMSKFTYDSYLSKHKCDCVNDVTVNGRVYASELLECYVTNIDFDIIKRVYEYDRYEILDGMWFHAAYLPKQIIIGILRLYNDKTLLKGVIGMEDEYMRCKGMLNSVYGMSVTDIIRDSYDYDSDSHIWEITKPTVNKIIDELSRYNNSKKRFLYYPWGIFVTAYSRRNLWYNILKIGKDYVYSDTDSIKLLNYKNHTSIINEYNQICVKKLRLMCDYWHIDFELCKPKNRVLGVFDYEGTSDYFKTLGAKRYLTYSKDNGYKLTVAGLSKSDGVDYLREIGNNDTDKIFDMFCDNLIIPSDRTGKRTHTYIDTAISDTVTDYRNNKLYVTQLSGLHLSDCPFHMGIDNKYLFWISRYRQGLTLKTDYAIGG